MLLKSRGRGVFYNYLVDGEAASAIRRLKKMAAHRSLFGHTSMAQSVEWCVPKGLYVYICCAYGECIHTPRKRLHLCSNSNSQQSFALSLSLFLSNCDNEV